MAAQASGSSFGAWYAQRVQQEQAEEQGDVEQGLLGGFNRFIKAQGLGEAQSQVTNLATKFVANIRGEDGVVANAKQSVEATLNYTARFRAFLGMFLIGVVFYLMAFFVGLPNIVLRPAKFAISVTLGSIFTMGSFTALLGPKAHLQSLLQRDRALFSIAYVGSLFLTLYASLWAKSYILVLLSTGLQIGKMVTCMLYVGLAMTGAFAWYALAAMPGGAAGLRMLNTVVMRGMQVGFATVSRCFSCCITSIVKL